MLMKEFINNSIEKSSEDIAIRHNEKRYSYAQVKTCVTNVSNLIGCNNKGKRIVILLNRSFELIISVLASIEAEKVFVPIDITLPIPKVIDLINRVNPSWIITNEEMDKTLRIYLKIENCSISYNIYNLNIIKTSYVSQQTVPEKDESYIYFTSGSTGKPKGVLGRDSSLFNFIKWEIETFDLGQKMNVSQITNPTFDPFLRDIFVPLCSGGTICIPDKAVVTNPHKFIDWIVNSQINIIHMVPYLFKILSKFINASQYFPHLKYIFLAGELIRGNDIRMFFEKSKSNVQLINLYGPTETTLAKFYYLINKSDVDRDFIPVGMPIDNNTLAYIYDNDLKLCLYDEPGTIFISSAFTSKGYFDDEKLTDQLFNKDDEHSNFIKYNTGDIGMFDCDGNLVVFGRNDNQIKIGGIKVNLEEIESQIINVTRVPNCIVFATNKSVSDNIILTACLETGLDIDTKNLRKVLSNYLPDYMLPVNFIIIKKMPLNSNGKIDRKKIAEIACDLISENNIPKISNDPIIEKVIDYIKKNVNQNFSKEDLISCHSIKETGIHSLNYIELLVTLEDTFCVEFPEYFLDIGYFENLQELLDSMKLIIKEIPTDKIN